MTRSSSLRRRQEVTKTQMQKVEMNQVLNEDPTLACLHAEGGN